MMRTLGQKRAEFALSCVTGMKQEALKERFEHFSAGAPAMILQNGFGQALAFWIAKAKGKDHSEHLAMFNIVKEWLCENGYAGGNDGKEFIENLTQMDQHKYIQAQNETLALLEWVKRYANAGL